MTYLLILLFFLFHYGRAQQTLFPAAIPLAVRSPYLSCWDHTTNGTNLGSLWPTTSNPGQILGWAVLVRIDGLTYSVLGNEPGLNGTANVTDTVITPTQTVIATQIGPMQVNLTFLNPIEPGDWVKQSIPFSYLALTAKSLDGAAHGVQVYSDISGEWNSGDRSQVILWSATSTSDVVYHTIRLQNPVVFNEIGSMAEWGSVYYAMKSANNVTFKIARGSRTVFALNGVLDNQTDPNFRSISPNFAVFAISRDLGLIQATDSGDPVVWTVGLTMDPAINHTDISGGAPQQRSLFYKTQYSDDTSLIVDFLSDFANASSRAQKLDQKILQGAAPVSNLLGDLVSLSTAQVYGGTHLTIGTDANGNYNKSDVMMFMKNIGGSKTNRVNAVETLYSAFPAFMYIDPTLGRPLLEPLLRLQASPNYTIPYAAADLGSSYPNVTISNSNHNQGVEQSGNMLIMTYAHARASGDGSLISRYYSLLTSWADYLSNSTLVIHDQSSADGLTTNNQTNLAIKGIIAIKAMSKMSSAVKRTADADKYSNIAAELYRQWRNLALDSDQHLLAVYRQEGSWTMGYNLFADVWLDTGVVESSVFNGQSSFIDNLALTSSFSNFGMPIDSLSGDSSIAISSWNLFVAAMSSNQDLRTNLISRVHNRASFNTSTGVFPLSYDSTHGSTILGGASPAQGAMYAPLALTAPVVQITINGTVSSSSSSTSHTGAIAGGVAGGVVALILVVGAIAFVRRRRRQDIFRGSSFSGAAMEAGSQIKVTPFAPTLTGVAPLEAGSQSGLANDGLTSSSEPLLPLPQSVAPVPVGLSSKELARMRSTAMRSPPTHTWSSPSGSQPSNPPTTISTAERSSTTTPPPETRRLQTEMESLRREVQELRAERFEAPPSYGAGGGV
ncbi:hypothetical protein EDB92DRAFT_2111814 [Lactarius akahatsu]|uniref:DUF1793-domain-containing protein n=1 Tax=Lactarius akahatsu TaxID=416441 RepID=A0AAD4LRI1_9AGAM|nr:hypothetical protein EDB92DRAFT_2111814 [Lactarius akahatsu]